MRKIYCKDLKKIISFNECYYARNENCSSCGFNLERIKQIAKPYSPRPKVLKFPPKNEDLIAEIKENIPLIKNLHSSFWRDGGFLSWQLLRLNKDYQEDMEKVWEAVWKCLAYFADKFADWKERFEIVSDSQLFYTEFYPRTCDTYDTWKETLSFIRRTIDYDGRYPNIITDGKRADFWSRYGEPIFWKGRILNAKFRPHETPNIEVEFGSVDKKLKIKIDRLGNLYPPPIPHDVRFPFPFETRFVYLLATTESQKLPSLRSLRSKLQPKTGRPRKEDWPTNLLVYELSRAGMKNMEIARLLFGIKKSTEFRPGEIKHPILVKIAKIKERMEGYVSEIYPITCI